MYFLFMVAMLLVILAASEIFVNALEHLGERLKISEGVTGSLFAAVGTAMPETMVPLIAIFAGTENQTLNEEIGVGAILGAPLMLATLAMGLLAIATIRERGIRGAFTPEITGVRRDLNFFLLAFGAATVALFVPHHLTVVRVAISSVLVLSYFVYIMLTLRASEQLVNDGHGTEADSPMLLNRMGLPNTMFVVVVQIALGVILLIAGAKGFIYGVEHLAAAFGVSALLVSLLVVPIATELPEKVNSVLWIRRRKDTLAFGNLTGAMVFQGALLPAIGVMLTPWEPRHEVFTGVVITLGGALWLRYVVSSGGLRVWHVMVNGVLYLAYLAVVLI
jgi:cation:H+ antiporter